MKCQQRDTRSSVLPWLCFVALLRCQKAHEPMKPYGLSILSLFISVGLVGLALEGTFQAVFVMVGGTFIANIIVYPIVEKIFGEKR